MGKKPSGTKPGQSTPTKEPTTADEFAARGWVHYSKKEFFRAESDFKKALESSAHDVDYLYGLAMSLQASGRLVEAVQVLETLLQVLEKPSEEDRVRYMMLSRLARGHISRIKTGDWNISH